MRASGRNLSGKRESRLMQSMEKKSAFPFPASSREGQNGISLRRRKEERGGKKKLRKNNPT